MDEWTCEKCGVVWDNEVISKYGDEYYCDECVDENASEDARGILENIRFESVLREHYSIQIKFTKDYPSISIKGFDFIEVGDYYDILGAILKEIDKFDTLPVEHIDMIKQFEDTYNRYK